MINTSGNYVYMKTDMQKFDVHLDKWIGITH